MSDMVITPAPEEGPPIGERIVDAADRIGDHADSILELLEEIERLVESTRAPLRVSAAPADLVTELKVMLENQAQGLGTQLGVARETLRRVHQLANDAITSGLDEAGALFTIREVAEVFLR